MARNWKTTKTRHGTYSGYHLHMELGEQPCPFCWQASQEYHARQRDVPYKKLRNRARASAQIRAYQDLARQHPEEYAEFFEARKIEAYQKADKLWQEMQHDDHDEDSPEQAV